MTSGLKSEIFARFLKCRSSIMKDFYCSANRIYLSLSTMKPSMIFLKLIGVLAFLLFINNPVISQQNHTILIVLDSSKRMAEDIGGLTKFDKAKQVIEDFINAQIPAQIGLTVFGSDEVSGSEAYFSPVLPADETANVIMNELTSLEPAGMSPIASALASGSQAFNVTNANYIILITDGVEDSGGGPVSITEALIEQGLLYRLDVVSFAENIEDNRLLDALVQRGGGNYYPIEKSEDLIQNYFSEINEEIRRSFSGMIGYRSFINEVNSFPAYGIEVSLLNSTGQEIEMRSFWRGIFEDLPPGNYMLVARHGTIEHSAPIAVIPGVRNDHNFVFDLASGGFTFNHTIKNTVCSRAYGTITRVYHSSGEIIYTGTSWRGAIDNLPEGAYQVEAYIEGLSIQTKEVIIQQGTDPVITFEFDVGRGRISYLCFLDPSQTNVANGTVIKMYRQPYNELVLEQTQWRGTTPYLPVGQYAVEGNYKGIIRMEEIEIHSDSTSALTFTFNIIQDRFSYQCFRNELRKTPATGVIFQVIDEKGAIIEESNFWRGSFQLPEGNYTLKALYQGVTKIQTLNLIESTDPIVSIIDFEL